MPASSRKAKTRAKRTPNTAEAREVVSDVEAAEALATPTRASRKRARGGETPVQPARNTKRKTKDTREVEREDTEITDEQEKSDNDTEPALPTEQEIISCLKVADKLVNATEDFANDLLEGQENVPGYGKIAGRDWVFIIRKVEVNIGRPEAQERLQAAEDGPRLGTPTARTVIDIDLGPDRQISRLHAVISYDSDAGKWLIIVNGRNGLRVDNDLYKRGTRSYLRNGSVIEIAGTQMAFITTSTEDSDGPEWDGSIIKQVQKSSEDDDEAEDGLPNGKSHVLGHNTRGQLQATSLYQSSYNGANNSNDGQPPRTHPHSQRGAMVAPGTPVRTKPEYPKSSPAANYARGVMMESTESIDYSQDSAKDLKPPHSYAQLIGMAILSTAEQQMTLNNIYKWIMTNYAFYRHTTNGWQNSIRHNLSLNKAFTKIARRTDEPGKGMKWMIEPSEFDTFVQQGMKGCRRPNPLPGTQSTLGSPNSPMDRVRGSFKRDEDATPPLGAFQSSYAAAMNTYTPDHRSRRPQLATNLGLGITENMPEFDLPNRSTPRNHGMTAAAHAAGSPPAFFVNEEGRVGPLDTPFPLRPSQRLAPPSTLRRPSDFIQFSSPAPFWKMEGLIGSTPMKSFDLSPLKPPILNPKQEPQTSELDAEDIEANEENNEDDEDRKPLKSSQPPRRSGSPVVGSSSPPRSALLDGSPTLSRPNTAGARALSQLASVATSVHAASPLATDSTSSGGNNAADVERSNDDALNTVQQSHNESSTPTLSLSATATAAPTHPTTATTNGGHNFSQSPPLTSASTQSFASSFPPPPQQSTQPTSSTYPPTQQPQPSILSNPPYHHPQHHHIPPAANPSGQMLGASAVMMGDDAEDEGIDLARGFTPIGSFHQRNHMAMSMGMAGGGGASFGR